MLSIGWTEMMLIAAIALIVVGPKDLPGMLRQVGRFAGQLRRMGNDFRAEINKAAALDDIKDLKQSVTAPITDVRRDVEKTFNSIGADGSVKPSGAITPRDPNSESVVNEIREAAGLPPSPDAAGEAAKKSITDAVKKAQADSEARKAAETAKKAADTATEEAPATKSRRRASTKAKPKAESPSAAKPKTPTRRAKAKSAKTTEAEDAAVSETAPKAKPKTTRKPAAKKTAARKPTTPRTRASSRSAGNDGAE